MVRDAPSKSAIADLDIEMPISGKPEIGGAPHHEEQLSHGRKITLPIT